MRKSYSEVFEDKTCKKTKVHPFIVEKGYQAIAGKFLSYDEILYLFEFKSPFLALKRYSRAEDYIELNRNGRFEYKKKYESKRWRTFLERWHLAMYWVCALIVLMPFVFGLIYISKFSIFDIPIVFFVFMVVFLFVGITELLEHVNMECANYIIEEQNKLESKQNSSEPDTQPNAPKEFLENT